MSTQKSKLSVKFLYLPSLCNQNCAMGMSFKNSDKKSIPYDKHEIRDGNKKRCSLSITFSDDVITAMIKNVRLRNTLKLLAKLQEKSA